MYEEKFCPNCGAGRLERPDDGRCTVFACGSSMFESLDGRLSGTQSDECGRRIMKAAYGHLVFALAQYGQHRSDCKSLEPCGTDECKLCDCGWDEARSRLLVITQEPKTS